MVSYHRVESDHPGWKVGGKVYRGVHKYLILTSGTYGPLGWVFTTMDLDTNEQWYIVPRPEDTYIPPIEDKSMLTRNWIVVSSSKGPSNSPIQHTSEQSAIDEAQRLALKHPTSTFLVYELRRAFRVGTVQEVEVGDTQ